MKIIENVKRYAHSKNIRFEKKEGLVEIVPKERMAYIKQKLSNNN